MPRILTTEEYETQRSALAEGETITDDMAKTIASWWHGGCDHNITALSHDCEWTNAGITDEIDSLLQRLDPAQQPQLRKLRQWVGEQWITSVWSAHGHTFVGSDGYESCLTCGAGYEEVHDDPDDFSHGRYCTNNGDDPTECTGDTSMVHGGGDCDSCQGEDDSCPHCQHECNCVICTG